MTSRVTIAKERWWSVPLRRTVRVRCPACEHDYELDHQIDKNGNINTSRTADGSYLMGSGGANDAMNAEEVLVTAAQSPDRFVDRVQYVTCPGEKVKTLVSDQGVFKKLGSDNEFTLTAYLANPDLVPSEKEAIAVIKQNCGWELKVSPQVTVVSPPSQDELMILRALDPKGIFRGERAKK